MSTVVTAEAPTLLRCAHCGATMSTPPPGLRADVLTLAALKFISRHEQPDGLPTPHAWSAATGERPNP